MALDDSQSTAEDTSLVIDAADLLANDSDVDGDALAITGFTQPANGTVIDNGDGSFTYTPDADYHGADAFSYTVADPTGATQTATVNLTIDPANDAPVALDDSQSTAEDTSLVITAADLLANDSDVDGDALAITGFTQPANGTVIDNGDGSFTYTPDADYTGADAFSYTVADPTGATASATVNLTIVAVDVAVVRQQVGGIDHQVGVLGRALAVVERHRRVVHIRVLFVAGRERQSATLATAERQDPKPDGRLGFPAPAAPRLNQRPTEASVWRKRDGHSDAECRAEAHSGSNNRPVGTPFIAYTYATKNHLARVRRQPVEGACGVDRASAAEPYRTSVELPTVERRLRARFLSCGLDLDFWIADGCQTVTSPRLAITLTNKAHSNTDRMPR